MSNSINSADVYTDVASLKNLKREAGKGSHEALVKTAEQFESLFLHMMIKSMRQSSSGEGLFDSDQSRFYQDMFDQQIAVDMAKKRQLGIADMLVKQLGKEQGGVEPAAGERHLTLDIERLRLSKPPLPLPASFVATVASGRAAETAPEVVQQANTSPVSRATSVPPVRGGFDSPADFVEKLYPLAEKYGAELGVEPKVLLAQAALETGWGKNVSRDAAGVSSHNLFNIKADKRWSGPETVVSTLEYENGRAVRQQAAFRAYPDFESSFRDYVAFLKSSPRYQGALEQAEDGPAFVRALHEAGYATDPKYSSKVNAVMGSDLLKQAALRFQNLTEGPLT